MVFVDFLPATEPPEKFYPVELRRVTALVEVDGELRGMVFLSMHYWDGDEIKSHHPSAIFCLLFERICDLGLTR